jgi:RNA polymerase sigma factor (sigma-70 family)
MPVTAVVRIDPGSSARLLARAAAGDEAAWSALFARFDPLVRGVARRHRLNDFDQQEVGQRTWLRLFLHVREIRDAEALPGWLMTTARRESLRLLAGRRDVLVPDAPESARELAGSGLDELLVAGERRSALHAALATLPVHQRTLLELLVTEPSLTYDEVGRALGIPRGSIGPTRRRSIARLRRNAGLLRTVV